MLCKKSKTWYNMPVPADQRTQIARLLRHRAMAVDSIKGHVRLVYWPPDPIKLVP